MGEAQQATVAADVVLAVHGGAGGDARDRADVHAGIAQALTAGRAALDGGAPSVDVATEAVAALEDAPVFNAGRGAVYTVDATQELEAAVMDGASRGVGAAAQLRHVRNPVRLARAVLDGSPHVLLAGHGAERFAREHDIELVDARFFHSERRLNAVLADTDDAGRGGAPGGTVGAVAVDAAGRLAAATSTGGVTGKAVGRVGDSPLPGAGTYADEAVAVSATGLGESFARAVAAHEVAALMRHADLPVDEAAARVVTEVSRLGGWGGVLSLDAAGQLAAPFDTGVLHRGWLTCTGRTRIAS